VSSTIQLPAAARQVLMGVNPKAGFQDRQEIVALVCQELGNRGFECRVIHEIDELAGEAARLLAAGELRAVVSAGGDGTLRLIASKTPPGTPLVVLPLGTENLLAKFLDYSVAPADLAELVAGGLAVRLDAGQANGSLFALMAGCGFDADVVRRVHAGRQGHIHHLSYAKPIVDTIRKYDYPELRVRYAPADAAEDAEWTEEAGLTKELRAKWVFVVNLPRYAGGLVFSPQASGTDGLLDVCTFKEGSLWSGLLYLGGVMLGQHEGMQDFVRIQTRRLRVEAAGEVPFQLDGDPGGELPAEFGVLPGRLTMVVGRSWAREHGFEADT
jgi:diacylglycerol kinase family enzyme